jgi:hypothetical protein
MLRDSPQISGIRMTLIGLFDEVNGEMTGLPLKTIETMAIGAILNRLKPVTPDGNRTLGIE